MPASVAASMFRRRMYSVGIGPMAVQFGQDALPPQNVASEDEAIPGHKHATRGKA